MGLWAGGVAVAVAAAVVAILVAVGWPAPTPPPTLDLKPSPALDDSLDDRVRGWTVSMCACAWGARQLRPSI